MFVVFHLLVSRTCHQGGRTCRSRLRGRRTGGRLPCVHVAPRRRPGRETLPVNRPTRGWGWAVPPILEKKLGFRGEGAPSHADLHRTLCRLTNCRAALGDAEERRPAERQTPPIAEEERAGCCMRKRPTRRMNKTLKSQGGASRHADTRQKAALRTERRLG